MKIKIDTVTSAEYQLTLTEDEINWLHGVMQNPMYGLPDDEADYDRDMRNRFWSATKCL